MPTPPAQSWFVTLRQPLSTFQTLVGMLAGLVTISGTLLSINGLNAKAPQQGELVALVHDARSRRPVAEATLDILTAQDALVTTVSAEPDGRVARRLKEGVYRVRVSHNGFATETRHIEVHAGERSEVRVALVPRPTPRVITATASDSPGPVRKFFRDLGF